MGCVFRARYESRLGESEEAANSRIRGLFVLDGSRTERLFGDGEAGFFECSVAGFEGADVGELFVKEFGGFGAADSGGAVGVDDRLFGEELFEFFGGESLFDFREGEVDGLLEVAFVPFILFANVNNDGFLFVEVLLYGVEGILRMVGSEGGDPEAEQYDERDDK